MDERSEVKNAVASYLQRRNYNTSPTFMVTKRQQLLHSAVEISLGKSNSILYPNCDPIIIDQNFTKFLFWLREQTEFRNRFHDIERIVAPLFYHLYMEILQCKDANVATSFFKCHFPSINENKCDKVIRELIFANGKKDKDIAKFKERFRSNRIVLKLQPDSLRNLKLFVLENCHILFLQILQTYFDFQVNDFAKKKKPKRMRTIEHRKEYKQKKFLRCLRDLRREVTPIFIVKIRDKLQIRVTLSNPSLLPIKTENSAKCHFNTQFVSTNSKHLVSCGLLKRTAGIVVFAQHNSLYLMPTYPMNAIFNLSNNSPMKFIHHSSHIYCIDLSPDNRFLVSGSADGTLCIYNLEAMTLVKKCTGHLGAIYCVKISGNGAYVATGSADGTARLWELKKGKILRIFCGHSQTVTCLDFHSNGLYLATGSTDSNIRLWCINKASCLRLLHASKSIVYSLVFSPCGKFLASASDDKSIRVWDILTSKVTTELKCKEAPILKMIWKTNGSEICAGTLNGVIKIWNVTRSRENNKYIEPIVTHCLNTNLLSIEYAFGTYGTLTV